MGFSVWILEAGGKAKAFKSCLSQLGRGKDRVLATYGRLLDLPPSLEAISPEMAKDIRQIPWQEIRSGQLSKLRDMCMGADELLLATDSDLEGEMIAFQVSELLGADTIPMSRVNVQGISPDYIAQALRDKSSINMNRVQAAIARRLFDRHLGFQLISDDDHYAQSMGRVISPLIKSLAEKPPINTRIECQLNDGWKAILRLPNHLSVHAETLCGMLSSLPAISPIKISAEKRVLEKPPLVGPEAVLTCSEQLNMPIKNIVEQLQNNYMEGRLSYPRTDSRRLGEVAQKWAQRIAQKSQTPFDPEVLQERSQRLDERAFDAHEAIIPMTDELVGKSPRTSYLSDRDKVLAVITAYTSQIGSKSQHYVLESGRFADDTDSAKWKKITSAYSRYLTLERCHEEGSLTHCDSPDHLEREPTYTEGRVRMWRDAPDLIAAKRLVELGLGRPSTLGIMAEKAASKYMNEYGCLNRNADLMLHKVAERCPILLREGVARKVEQHLLSTEKSLSVAQRLSQAWNLLRGKPVTAETTSIQPEATTAPVIPGNDATDKIMSPSRPTSPHASPGLGD